MGKPLWKTSLLLLALLLSLITVTGSSAGASLRITQKNAVAGSKVTLRGTHLTPNRVVHIYAFGKLLARAKTNSHGSFKRKIKLPSKSKGTIKLRIYVGGSRLTLKYILGNQSTQTTAPTTSSSTATTDATTSTSTSPTSTPTTSTATTTTTTTTSSDPAIVAAGDIACKASDSVTSTACRQSDTAALAQTVNPKAIITLGDEQYDSGALSEFQGSFALNWGSLSQSLYPVPGNHEYNTSGGSGYFDYFGSKAGSSSTGYYSYDIGSWHLIALNSNSDCTTISCSTGSTQELWLRSDLAAHTNTCTLAYWHHPRFSTGAYTGATSVGPFWTALYEYGADLVLNGHDHNYQRWAPINPSGSSEPNTGIRQFIAGTGGKSHYSFGSTNANVEARDSSSFGVLKLTLHTSSYDWQFIPTADSTFTDSGTASCH